jgi:phosphoglycerate dehydrogenase-like enzyme
MKAKNRLLIISRDAAVYDRLLKALAFPDLDIDAVDSAEKALTLAKDCTIILGEPKRIAPVVDRTAHLLWVQSTFAGVEALLHPQARTNYILSGVKDVFGPFMSEYVFSYMVAIERHAFDLYRNQQNRIWQKIPYKSLKGRLLGICGIGSIGTHLAQTANHFGMRVWGYKKTSGSIPEAEQVFTEEGFKQFLSGPDYIINTLPSTRDTYHKFDDTAFSNMKVTAVLINIGRGSAVSEKALIRALQDGQIGGAVLDVFEKEPLPQESPLWSLPNVFITPHISGYSFPSDIVGIFTENYRRFLSGSPLLHRVDFQRGY